MSYYGIIGNRTYIFEDVENYLLALDIMNDLQEIFETRLNNYDTPFEISDKTLTTEKIMSEESAKYLVDVEEVDIHMDYAIQYDILTEELKELRRLIKQKKAQKKLIESRLRFDF